MLDSGEMIPLGSRYGVLQPIPDKRQPYEKKLAIYMVLASVLLERMAFYSLGENLVVFLGSAKFQWSPSASATAVYILYGTTYISTLLFGIISDTKLSRAKTITIGFIIYLIGYILFTINAGHSSALCTSVKSSYGNTSSIGDQYCNAAILGTLICIAIGAGAVQSNMAVFGANQMTQSTVNSRYFDKYILAVNIGAIIATSAIPYIQNRENDNFLIGFIVAASMLLVSALIFLVGQPFYIKIKPQEILLTKCIQVTMNAFQSWFKVKRHKYSADKQQRINDDIAAMGQSFTLLDYAKAPYGGKFPDRIVDDVKSLRAAIVVFILLIPYWLIYHQPDSIFPSQGKQMSGKDLDHVITWMAIADPLVIIIGIVIFHLFVYKRLDGHRPNVQIATKLIIGMCLAALTMCVTGVIEVVRLRGCDIQSGKNESSLTVYAQLPQYIGIGLAELFATVACFEFAYYAAPRSAQSLFMSLRFFSMGVSSYIGAAYIAIFPTTSFSLNFSCQNNPTFHWSFYTYFFILATVQIVFIIIFILCQKKFQIVKVHRDNLEPRSSVSYQSSTSSNK